MIVVQPDVETMLGQIGSVLRHEPGVVVFGFAEQEPADVGPPGAIARRMRIAGLVGFLVMNAMRGHPENRPAFQGKGAADGEEVFQN